MAVYVGLLPNFIVLVTGWHFFSVAPGSEIRPMAWAGLVMFLALAPIGVIPYSIFAMVKEKSMLPIVGILFSFCPLPFNRWLLQFAADKVGFVVES
jgi:hypothetical protein